MTKAVDDTQPAASPDLVLVWDPAVLDERRYAQLVALFGDLARAEGGLGIERIRSLSLGVPSRSGCRGGR